MTYVEIEFLTEKSFKSLIETKNHIERDKNLKSFNKFFENKHFIKYSKEFTERLKKKAINKIVKELSKDKLEENIDFKIKFHKDLEEEKLCLNLES
jgi:hypothetical protein